MLGQSAPLGQPASNLGMPERWNLKSLRSRTELRTDVSTGGSVTSNSVGAKIGGDQCKTGDAEWVRFRAWNVVTER